MFRAGEEYHPANMLEAQQKGVAIIVQEAGTLPSMDVAAKLFVGNFQKFRRGGFLGVKRMHVEANKILDEIGAAISGRIRWSVRSILKTGKLWKSHVRCT